MFRQAEGSRAVAETVAMCCSEVIAAYLISLQTHIVEGLSRLVKVCMDGFIFTHVHERIDLPTQEQVDAFLPAFEPRQLLDPDELMTIGAMVGPEAFMEVRYLMHAKQMQALDAIPQIAADFAETFGRDSGGLVRGYHADDAETIVVALGSVLGTIQDVVH